MEILILLIHDNASQELSLGNCMSVVSVDFDVINIIEYQSYWKIGLNDS